MKSKLMPENNILLSTNNNHLGIIELGRIPHNRLARFLLKRASLLTNKEWQKLSSKYASEENISFNLLMGADLVALEIGKKISQWCKDKRCSLVWDITEMPDELILHIAEVLYAISIHIPSTFVLYSWPRPSEETFFIDIGKIKVWEDKIIKSYQDDIVDSAGWLFVGENQSLETNLIKHFISNKNKLEIYYLLNRDDPFRNMPNKYFYDAPFLDSSCITTNFYFSLSRGHQILKNASDHFLDPAKNYFIASFDPKHLLLSSFLAYKKMKIRGIKTKILLSLLPLNQDGSTLVKHNPIAIYQFHWMD